MEESQPISKPIDQSNNLITVNREIKSENYMMGIFIGSMVGIGGAILAAILGYIGILSAFVPFLIAILVIRGYQIGAKTLTKKSIIPIILIILVWIVISFFVGDYVYNVKAAIGDLTKQYGSGVQINFFEALTNQTFQSLYLDYVKSGEIFVTNTRDILISLLFAVLGTWSTLKKLFLATKGN